ncbi:uncharacterized protein L3040_004153 [Drepanopeziza brunnea f. sp. 'multigermtubi']|uniref:Uncharacterized protein n=1 Tax=Marssonina brunnea f. sp. multigermtubi (strain MB_m1) TaxID=1072389 RepID=K1X5Z0_MARBU|nr:uncharacterized protein MBM_01238 [Drepanopeziza brunnea f. sp. 'multigermtubi' MB_m1]EKD20556.1 hypothetical protein MBM_01238 [Drepanopeziza brunnea f. sp. 'multigermtubi' MB_m1]KAJ5042757.1 hypothetical protein L3040_004153 [Drepanopeziza brunnea f. sp. 'multigermtubi']
MTDWLRPVFGRGRTYGASNASERPSNLSFDESVAGTESEDGISIHASTPRLRPSSRVSSFIGIRPATPPIPPTPDTFFSLRNPETVYHKPSGDQMAEMLKVIMMNQSSVAPVPVEYNSAILHVLEAYQELGQELRRKNESIEELKQGHTKDIKDFETLATQWDLKERDYKNEMRKLEVLLSNTEGGMEKVSLARTKSTVHGSKIGERIGREVGTIKARNVARNSRGRSDSITEIPIEITPNDKYRADRFFKTRIRANAREVSTDVRNTPPEISSKGRVLESRASTSSFPLYASPAELVESVRQQGPDPDLAALSQAQLEELARRQAQAEFGAAFNSSSESESSTNSPKGRSDTVSPLAAPSGLGIGFQARSMSINSTGSIWRMADLSIRESIGSKSRYDSLSQESPSQVAFSFRPGDDEVLAQRARTGQTPRRTRAGYSHPRSSTEASQPPSESPSLSRDGTFETSRHSRTEATKPSGRTAVPPRTSSRSRPREIQETETTRRDESNSSFVTALRHNSGRSSAHGSQNSSRNRRNLDRNSGSGEAVTAAARAFNGAKRRPVLDRSGSSGYQGARERRSQDEASMDGRGPK